MAPSAPAEIDAAIRLHQAGRLAEAKAAYEYVLATDPAHAEARHLLGVIAEQEGRHEAAASLIAEAVRLDPANAQARSNLALALRSLGRLSEAIGELREAVRLAPRFMPARTNLATLLSESGDAAGAESELVAAVEADPHDAVPLRRLGTLRAAAGRLAEAIEPLSAAARLAPKHAPTLINLGIALKDTGRVAEAAEVLGRAVAADPTSPDAASNLGLSLMGLGRLAEAERVLASGLAVTPDHVDLLNNMAVVLKQAGRQPEGEPLLARALARSPDDLGVLVNLGDLLVAAGRAAEALPLLERAVAAAPKSEVARNNLALALKDLDREEEATAHLEAALSINPGYLPALHNLANNLVATGRAAEGVAKFLEVLDRDPGNLPAIYGLATGTDHPLDDSALARIDGLLAAPRASAESRQLLHMAAAAGRDRRGEHDAAIVHAIESGRLKRALDRRAGVGFDRGKHLRLVEAVIGVFSAESIARMPSSGLDTVEPVFVLGMPRSGTTLVEQILASHPLIHGAGETDAIANAALSLADGRMEPDDPASYPRTLAGGRCSPEAVRAAAERVLAGYRASAELARGPRGEPPAARVVEKTTTNVLHVGLIRALFPRARIIHTTRDPRDTCVSCLFHNFTGLALHFTNDLGDLGFAHRQKDRLMAHWHAVMPGAILDVPYEAVVADTELWARRMLEHVGLEWSDRCLEFHKATRRVRTASNLQVRKPIYTSSVARWKRYERHLAPLVDALAGRDTPEPDESLGVEESAEPGGSPAQVRAHGAPPTVARGIAAHAAGRHEEAIGLFREAVAAAPLDPRPRMNLGVALKAAGALPDAEACFRQAIALAPGFAPAHNNLGILLSQSGLHEAALASFEEALRLDPGYPDARHNRGAVLAEFHRHEEAIADIRAALARHSGDAEYHNSLGASLAALGRVDEALACYETALSIDPAHAWAHFNRSQAWLARGEWAKGFAEWDWRKRLPTVAKRGWDKPDWDGSPRPGATLLLHCEQGLGDTLQFIRFARAARERVGRVVVECQAALVPLLSRCGFLDSVVARGSPLPEHDVQAALLSLPHLLGIGGDALAAGGPSLAADPALVAHWRTELTKLPGRKIGVAWQGNPKYKRDAFRSMPLSMLAPIAMCPGVTLVSLQKGVGRDHLADPATQPFFPLVDFGDALDEAAGAFMDTAAIMASLDLVITTDTSIPHLAGGLGVPVWVALSAHPDFRWMESGENSPWYPSMRLFRQRREGDWKGVVAAMKACLERP